MYTQHSSPRKTLLSYRIVSYRKKMITVLVFCPRTKRPLKLVLLSVKASQWSVCRKIHHAHLYTEIAIIQMNVITLQSP